MNLISVRNELSLGRSIYDIKLKVTYYARVSTDSDLQLNSLNNQNNYFEELIKSNENWEYIKGYVDLGISGINDIKRPEFMKMIEDATKGKFDLIITKEISRFSRNTLDSIKYTRELLNNGVCVYFLSDNINTIYNDSELRLTIMASLAQDEVRRISERVKFGMKRSIKNGHILGNNLLYGYRKKDNKSLKIDKQESLIVKDIFNMYVYKKKSLTSIVKYLNENKIKTSMNNKWSVTSLKRIIENPKYKGYYCASKSEVIDYISKKVFYKDKSNWTLYKDNINIPPIINEELWNKANEILNNNSKNKIYKKSNSTYSTLLYCAYDNSLFYRRSMKHDMSWYCSSYLKYGKCYCNNKSIFESELNKIINYFINKFIDINKFCECFNFLIRKDLKEEICKIVNSNDFNNKLITLIINKIFIFNNENVFKINVFLNINMEYFIFKIFEFTRKNEKIIYNVSFIGLT